MPDIEFSKKLISAVDERTQYYNSVVLPQLLEKYRLIHTCVKNMIEVLIQKSIIKPDPYKLEKKISGVEIIPNEPYLDTERALVIGTRISDYEAILDFVCTYYKFSVENTGFNTIKKFVEFNNTFNWAQFNTTSNSPNTRGFAILYSEAKMNSPALTANMMNDNIFKCANTTKEINMILKDLNEFQKEVYKAVIRKDIFDHPKFNMAKASESIQAEVAEIKKFFPAIANKQPFYPALVEEVAKEDLAPDKASLQEALLQKLEIKSEKTEKKKKKIDTKEILMGAVHALSGLAPQLMKIMEKINENHNLLQAEHQSFFDKFVHALRKAFNIDEPTVLYTINITDATTGTVRREKINIHVFISEIERKINFYNSFSLKHLPGYQKIEKNTAEKILEFLNKQISEAQRLVVQIAALDAFFKEAGNPDTKKLIKGMKMELTTMKNTIINTNQHRADYISLVEEEAQMRKLGIEND